jgi:hypothetical protein
LLLTFCPAGALTQTSHESLLDRTVELEYEIPNENDQPPALQTSNESIARYCICNLKEQHFCETYQAPAVLNVGNNILIVFSKAPWGVNLKIKYWQRKQPATSGANIT